jgi:hypothetical protein
MELAGRWAPPACSRSAQHLRHITAADGPIITTLGFASPDDAADLCFGFVAEAASGRDRGSGWGGSARPTSPGGRGGTAPTRVDRINSPGELLCTSEPGRHAPDALQESVP